MRTARTSKCKWWLLLTLSTYKTIITAAAFSSPQESGIHRTNHRLLARRSDNGIKNIHPGPDDLLSRIHDPLWTEITPDEYSGELPETYAYPHYYEPHPVAALAAGCLKKELLQNPPCIKIDLVSGSHDGESTTTVGWDSTNLEAPIGKMFGVLVVQSSEGKLGYFKGYSGRLPGEITSAATGFVPLIYNRMDPEGFYVRGKMELNALAQKIEKLERDPRRTELRAQSEAIKNRCLDCLADERAQQKVRKAERKRQRMEAAALVSDSGDDDAYQTVQAQLVQESNADQRQLKALKAQTKKEITEAQLSIDVIDDQLAQLKRLHEETSSNLEAQLFDHYQLLNANGETASLRPLFSETTLQRPPPGAGDCAAPKLLQYAFSKKRYRPLAMAEFWWGRPPADVLRKHNLYYPACRGKCEPILNHMLRGLNVAPNPLEGVVQSNENNHPALQIIYEDDCMVVVNKPPEMLSVPGRLVTQSVYTEMKERYSNATGPLLVHRLDMSTSGLLLVAKNKDTHKLLSAQFIDRSVKKRYTALLEGTLCPSLPREGRIDLPLASDYINRPMQKVDFENGKPAATLYEIVSNESDKDHNRTRVRFYPITGRSHQLRVHAAHAKGLNTPIVGDDIYGQRDDRLCLHAGWIEITHPMTQVRMAFTADDPI